MLRSILRVAALTTLTLACGTPPATPLSFDHRAVTDSVSAAVRAFDAAVHSRDPARMLEFYVPDSSFRYLSDGQMLRYGELATMMKGFWPTVRSFEGELTSVEVIPLTADAAVSRTPYWEAMTDTSGRTMRQRGDVSMAWVLRDGRWKIIYTHAVHTPDTSAAK